MELNQALYLWLDNVYHQRPHSSTGQSPFARFTSRMECVRDAPNNLRDYFRKTVRRRVAKDRTISLKGRIFEAPVPLIDKQVSLLYHEDEPDQVEIMLEGQSFGMASPVNIHVNCRVKRDKWRNIDLEVLEGSQEYQGGSLWGKRGRQ